LIVFFRGHLLTVPDPKGSRFQKRFQFQRRKITRNFGCPWMSTDDMNRWASQVAVLWLDHLLRGEPLPFPVQSETKSSVADKYEKRFLSSVGRIKVRFRNRFLLLGRFAHAMSASVFASIFFKTQRRRRSRNRQLPIARWSMR
jgi:hypothetical protein